jgi:hypothetical protein
MDFYVKILVKLNQKTIREFFVFKDGIWGNKRWFGLKGVIIGK